MEAIISISRVVEARREPGGEVEVCATMESHYDKANQQLVTELGSYVEDIHDFSRNRTAWLPQNETLREHVAREEATDVARDIFQRWAERVRHSVPKAVIAP